VFVALGIQPAMRMRHITVCDLPLSTIFFHIISKTAGFSGGGGITEHKICFDFLYNFCLKDLSFKEAVCCSAPKVAVIVVRF
jgi:hypothetical protein